MPARVTSARIVGREAEVAALVRGVERAAAGSAQTVLVAAAGGVGATRLVDEVVARTGGPNGPIVVRGRSHPLADPPYAAISAALSPVLEALPDAELARVVGAGAGDDLRVLPRIQDRVQRLGLAHAAARETTDERRQPRVFEGLLGLLARLGEQRPVLLVLEDLHVADAATRAFVTFAARIARDERLCLVATYQPDRLTRDHPLVASIATIESGPRAPHRIALAPLDRGGIAMLVEGIEGERPAASVVVLVAERSGGVPLVAEELVAARRELRSASLTGSLGDLVRARLDRRSPECRRVLRLLAPARRPLARDRLAAVSMAFEAGADRPPPRSSSLPRRGEGGLDADLAAGLAEAIEQGFVVPDGEEVAFRHELLARAVEADLLPAVRPRHHAALAAAWDDHPAIAAAHWLAARRPAEARDAATRWARAADEVDAPADALAGFELALELTAAAAGTNPASSGGGRRRTDPDAGDMGMLLQQAGEAAAAALRPTRAVAYARAALPTIDERTERVAAALLHERLGQYRLAAADADGALRAMRRAVELVPRAPTVERARVLASLAQLRMIHGGFRDAEKAALEALSVCEAVGPGADAEAIHATITLGVLRGWGDRPDEGVELLRQARDRAGQLGRIDDRFRATANLTTVLDLLGRDQEAVDVAYAGIAEARDAGLQAVYGNFLGGNVADTLFSLGRWQESRDLSLRALDWSPTGVSFVNAIVNLVIVEIETEAGEEASRLLGRILVELDTGRDIQYAVPAYQATVSLALWSDDLADAVRAAERGWQRVHDTEDWTLIARMAATALEVDAAVVADALERRRIGDVAAARQRATQTLAEAEAAVSRSRVDPSLGSRREAEAHLATARAFRGRLDGDDDPATWATIARAWRELGDPYRVARALWRQAEAHLSLSAAGPPSGTPGGRADARAVRADARQPLQEAAAIGLELGARPLLRELRELARRSLIALPPAVDEVVDRPAAVPTTTGVVSEGPAPEGMRLESAIVSAPMGNGKDGETFGLSAREREVLALISQGRTNREIGDRLFISQKTVGVHVGNILAKLGVSGRVEAATVAIRLNLTEHRPQPARR